MRWDLEIAIFRDGPFFDVRTKDGANFENLAFKEFTGRTKDGFVRFGIPIGAMSDGVSDPQLARDLDPSLRDRIFGAGFAHDSAYRDTLQVWDGRGMGAGAP